MPRFSAYHPRSAPVSIARKKIPPTPVTRSTPNLLESYSHYLISTSIRERRGLPTPDVWRTGGRQPATKSRRLKADG